MEKRCKRASAVGGVQKRDTVPSYFGFEGFFKAKLVVEALKKAGPDLTHERLVVSVEGLRDHGSRFVDLAVLCRSDKAWR